MEIVLSSSILGSKSNSFYIYYSRYIVLIILTLLLLVRYATAIALGVALIVAGVISVVIFKKKRASR